MVKIVNDIKKSTTCDSDQRKNYGDPYEVTFLEFQLDNFVISVNILTTYSAIHGMHYKNKNMFPHRCSLFRFNVCL